LEFAEHGTFATTVTHATQLPQQNMITLIAEEIKQHGYKVDTFIGRSEFKVDIAIADPRHPEGYLLGILCDGKNYYETKTTRDREIVQPSVLTMLHWNIMRIWSIDWFENSHKVIERIMDKLEELQKDNPDKDGLDLPLSDHRHHTFDITEEPILEQINEREKEYIFANLPNVHYTSDIDTVMASPAQVKHQLEELISIEQPITNTLLYQRIADIWGISRVTSRLQAMINSLLVGVYKDPLSDNSISIYWEVAEKSINYKEYRLNSRRDIRDIPIIEVMNAALYVLEQQISLPAEDLKRLTSQVLGFSRKGANLDAATSRAVQLLLDQAVIKEKDGLIWQIS
jgi:very-short-patch-repair endonuclease